MWGIKKHHGSVDIHVPTTRFKQKSVALIFAVFHVPTLGSPVSLSLLRSPLLSICGYHLFYFLYRFPHMYVFLNNLVFKNTFLNFIWWIIIALFFCNFIFQQVSDIHPYCCMGGINMPQGGYVLSPTGRYVSCFKYFVIANSTCLMVYVCKGFSESPLNDIARSWDMYIFNCTGRPNCFPEWLAKLYFHQQCLSVEFLPVLAHTWYCETLRFLSGFSVWNNISLELQFSFT